MGKKAVLVIVLALVMAVGSFELALAGVEPSPFQPEINQLHSIELNVAAINKRLAKLNELEIIPEGTENYLGAMANQMDILSARMAETLAVLPAPSLLSPYDGQDEVVSSLDGIRLDTGGVNDIMDTITSRMGVEPSPFKIGSIAIINYIDFHLLPILPAPTLP